jgi:hypothetical protein
MRGGSSAPKEGMMHRLLRLALFHSIACDLSLNAIGFATPNEVVYGRVRGLERSGTHLLTNLLFHKCHLPEEGHCNDGRQMLDRFRFVRKRDMLDRREEVVENLRRGRQRPDEISYKGRTPCWHHYRLTNVTVVGELDSLTNAIDGMVYVVIIKSPAAWITSFCGWSLRCTAARNITVDGLAEEYSKYASLWLSLRRQDPQRVIIVRYENLLRRPGEALAPIVATLRRQQQEQEQEGGPRQARSRPLGKKGLREIAGTSGIFSNAANWTPAKGAGCLEGIGKNLALSGTPDGHKQLNIMMSHGQRWSEEQKYYLDCSYLEKMTAEQRRAISRLVSVSLLNELGFQLSGERDGCYSG